MRASPLALLCLASCASFGDEVGAISLDYRIDRPVVAAIRLTPPDPIQGETVTIDALVLSPDPVQTASVDVCGLDEVLPSELYGVDCFQNPDLITPLASALPARWDIPVLGAACGNTDTGGLDTASEDACASRVPLRIRAWTEEEQAAGALEVELPRTRAAGPRPRLSRSPSSLTFEGSATRGADIGLVYRIDWDGELDFRWYVDKGELHHTGRTATTWRSGDRHTTRNQLTIPVGWVGPLRVVVVASAGSGNVAWDVLTLEVE